MKNYRLLLLLVFCLISVSVNGQINIRQKVKNQTTNRADNKVDQGIDTSMDAAEDKVKDLFKKKKKTQEEGLEEEQSEDLEIDQALPEAKIALAAYSKYDFIPGDQVLLFEDFSQDAVGDFPALWTTDAAGEVNTLNIASGNWFNLNSTEGTYWLMQDIDFPKNFILEMDIVPKKEGGRYAADMVFFGETSHSEMDKNNDPGSCGLHIKIEKNIWETAGYKKGANEKLTGSSTNNLVEPEQVNHVIVWVQNRRVRIYHKGGKVIDIPTNIYEGSKFSRLCFKLYRGASAGSYISNIKITTAAPDTRNKLLTEGKLVTYGIYFDVNKDEVKPESYGTLKEIAAILNEVPEVRVKIYGHTDADGEDETNMDLSKRRAASVKAELANSFGVNTDRLDTDGWGETKPVAPNDSPVNKALNRRVEFIKL